MTLKMNEYLKKEFLFLKCWMFRIRVFTTVFEVMEFELDYT